MVVEMSLYFLRHGESQANADRILAGQFDSPLTEKGKLQAQQEAMRLQSAGMAFDIIISSPLSRALDTAKYIAIALAYSEADIQIEPRVIERNVGDLRGQSVDQLQVTPLDTVETAETAKSLVDRCQAVLSEITSTHANKNILLVSHAGVGEALFAIINGEDTTFIQLGQHIPNARATLLQ